MIHVLIALILVLMTFIPAILPVVDTEPQQSQDSVVEVSDEAVRANVLEAYGKLPLLFIQNQGQLDSSVEYYVKASGQTLYFTDDGIVFDLLRYEKADDTDLADRSAERLVFSLHFLDANKSPLIQGGDRDKAIVNYFISNDPDKWHTDIPTCKEIVYSEIYPDIDLRLYGRAGMLEYDFVVKPGADVADIVLAYDGVDGIAIEDGELMAGTAFGDMKQTQPYIYQPIDGEEMVVDGGFRLVSGNTYGFEVAAYDASYPLIIDPALSYSTYLGGSGYDYGYGIAVDTSGCAYVTGDTYSTGFPTTPGSYNSTYGKNGDAFVTRLDTTKSSAASLIYSTYLGGSGEDYGNGIAVDTSGCAYVTGYTLSTDFPTLNPYIRLAREAAMPLSPSSAPLETA